MAKEKETSTNPEVAALQAQLNELQQQMAAMLQQQQQPNSLMALQHQLAEMQVHNAKGEKRAIEVEAHLKEISDYISLPTQVRSQYEANKSFPSGSKVFSVLLGTGKKGECPQLFIKADSPVDAEARYKAVCGIRYVVPTDTHPEWSKFTIADVTADPMAKQAVEAAWVYQPAV